LTRPIVASRPYTTAGGKIANVRVWKIGRPTPAQHLRAQGQTPQSLARSVDTRVRREVYFRRGWNREKARRGLPASDCAPSHSGFGRPRNGPRRPRISRAPRISEASRISQASRISWASWISLAPRISRPQQIPRPLPWTRRHRGWPYILVGSVVVLPAALLLFSWGSRAAVTGHRGGATGPVVLVLLSERQSVLSDGANVPRDVDQSPAASTVNTRAALLDAELDLLRLASLNW